MLFPAVTPLLGKFMTTRASIANHPLHAMLIALPIGLWVFSLAADLLFLATRDARWDTAADFTLAGGLVGGVIAAVPGLIDFLGLVDARAKKVATLHMLLNIAIMLVAAVNVWLRFDGGQTLLPIWISGATVVALVISGWLGGELVHVLGVTQPRRNEMSGSGSGTGSPNSVARSRYPSKV